jgi:membrane-bound lytic murein transglycosylase D
MKKRMFLLPALLWILGTGTQAQNSPAEEVALTKEINWQLDSLLPCYHYQPSDSNALKRDLLNTYGYAPDSLPSYSTDIVAQRLKGLGSMMSMDYNEYVQAYINMYTLQRRGQVERMLGLAELYFPIFEAELDRMDMPIELKYLPVIESALIPNARSRVGATGLWQFMLPTGKMYGLDVTSYVDERRDPYKATHAACRYLKNMYKTYGDWLLVIAAYNCGPGNVNKALARNGGRGNFWEIRQHLPQETRGYVPAFIAAAYVFNFHAEHNIFPRYVDFTFQQDTLMVVREKISLVEFARATGTDFYVLKDLNPELKLDIVPYSDEPYVLRVPMRTGQVYAAYRDSIQAAMARINADTVRFAYDTNRVSKLTNTVFQQESPSAVAESRPSGTSTAQGVLVYHKVRPGDVVGKLATKYHVSTKQIQSWNGLRGYTIKSGQKLKIYVPERYANVEKSESEAKTATASAATSTASAKASPTASAAKEASTKYHTVQSGDTLWEIANSYTVSVEKIMELNNLSNNRLEVGQKLRVQ